MLENHPNMFVGIDVGSLTAKGVILNNREIIASFLASSLPTAQQSIEKVMAELKAQLPQQQYKDNCSTICLTGYGRFQSPFPAIEKSEISCHAMGAFWGNSSVKTILDIGGQDSKIINISDKGLVTQFAMNDRCAAGTGRSLEILARVLDVSLDKMADMSQQGRGKFTISNRCSIFMEKDVLDARLRGIPHKEIAAAISQAVAKRVLQLGTHVKLTPPFAITGGVSKNRGVVDILERLLDSEFVALKADPQLMGAIGAALFAEEHATQESHATQEGNNRGAAL